ncbi:FecR family protein [Mucilaginibacter sp. X4EP1]|uniref:FecR family protein n=1 Tax=Mucilaginibacter sp. X4EP1 TaxID=2723092 RepID=UPI0021691745|nr:FecR family protein [Mucilaginibacter sp. X4EP1]MCS3812857.1 ribosomal protein S4E [Mucilaginibacter sp. X4EP1]
MQPSDIEQLLERYNQGIATAEEIALVETWYTKYKSTVPDVPHQQLEEDQQQSLNELITEITGKNKRGHWPTFAIAASILFILSSGVFFLMFHRQQQPLALNKPVKVKSDVAPGGNKAILTLSNGSTIVLTGAKNGTLASQGNMVINKTADGLISYADSKENAALKSLVYNTASTPRGGQYQFVLADGTKVWLNSASSIKYPVQFIGNERKVELTGEAYFEVAHDAKKPFRVVSNGQTVEVLGTHFNVNAYGDEGEVKTTLLEGSVKVSSQNINTVIKPGEQAQFDNGKIKVKNVDVDEVVAWKNGFFYFEDNNIQEVMRQLARWYDVDIKYEGKLPSREFSGEISRNVNASQILDILSFKKIHYKIEGKTIVVMP